jgi:uncharacterized protein (TIGR02678 family)
MSGSLSDALAASRTDELRRAARALLARPVLRAHSPGGDALVLVRRHATELREWFDRNTGWRLHVDNTMARLVKTTTRAEHTHPARDTKSRVPFHRRRYVLTCLALAALDRADAQTTLGRLAELIMLGAADPELVAAGVEFTLDTREQRTDLVAVVRLLLDLGVLGHVAGDDEAFVKNSGDALYDVHRRVVATLLATLRGPSTVDAEDFGDRLAGLTAELAPTTDDLRNRQLRHQLTRALLDGPVVYYADLDEAQLAYLTSQRHAITTRITALTGLVAEVRAEGIAMVDPLDALTDVKMPESGTEGHATLLLAEYLSTRDGHPVPLADLHHHMRELATEHRSYWRRSAMEPGAEVELTAHALDRLEALRLVDRDTEHVRARPALARYAVTAPTITLSR